MSKAENKKLIQRFIKECVQPMNIEVADQFIHPEWHYQATDFYGPEGFKTLTSMGMKMIEYISIDIKELVAEDDKVALQEKVTAKHIGEFLGVPATGKTLTWPYMAIFHIREGKITGWHECFNALAVMQQLQQSPESEE